MTTWRLGDPLPWLPRRPGQPGPRLRVVVDNDFSGDPDGLVQLAHHVLSPSVDVRAVIGSRPAPEPRHEGTDQAAAAVARARELLAVMGVEPADRLVTGSAVAMRDRTSPLPSDGARRIMAEAMRDDVDTPLFVACGAGLTAIASALLIQPAIAERLTLVWIGGAEHPGLAEAPPGAPAVEYNQSIDPVAAQVVFDSAVPLWQVPRDRYRQCLVSDAELRRRVAPQGPTGAFLHDAIEALVAARWLEGELLAETYALGDSPLVLLTALQSYFERDDAANAFVTMPRPRLDDDGRYAPNPGGAPARVYTRLETRLMFGDLYAKLADLADWQAGRRGA